MANPDLGIFALAAIIILTPAILILLSNQRWWTDFAAVVFLVTWATLLTWTILHYTTGGKG